MEMIERVSRAIWAERRRHALTEGIELEDWDEEVPAFEAVANNIMGEARAAIQAMREPTEAMIEAGWDSDKTTYDNGAWNGDIDVAYTAMIDEALK